MYFHLCTYVYGRRGRRSRYVHSQRPTVGYFTDSSLMSGVAAEVSTNDASDEYSSDEGLCIIVNSAIQLYFKFRPYTTCMLLRQRGIF